MDAASETSFSSPDIPLFTSILMKIFRFLIVTASRKDGTVNRRFINFFTYTSPANPKPVEGVSTFDITVDSTRNLWFRLFIPTVDHDILPVIVFFHGGGFAFLSPDVQGYDKLCRQFAQKSPAIVISVNYRLVPEHSYPSQYEDGYDILKFLDDENNKETLPNKIDLSRCFLAGDSAGANISHYVALQAGEYQFRKLKVIGVIAIQAFFGGEERTKSEIELDGIDPLGSTARADWLWRAYLPRGEGMNRDHEAINVSGPRAIDIRRKEFPPTLVVLGGFDCLKDWEKRYYEYLKKSGKEAELLEYPGMPHGFYLFDNLKEQADLVSRVIDFIRRQCSKHLNYQTLF